MKFPDMDEKTFIASPASGNEVMRWWKKRDPSDSPRKSLRLSPWIGWSRVKVEVLSSCACDLRAPHRLTRPAFEAHPGAITFPPEADSLWSHFSTGPSASRNTFSVSHDHGRQRSDRGPQHLSCPYVGLTCTLGRLRAEKYGRPVTQSIATPEPSSRTIRP